MNNVSNMVDFTAREGEDLASLVRPLLELLESVTGLESTYLTSIDMDKSVQRIIFSRNSKQLSIPEGLAVPWEDSLCKRALDEQQLFTDDVAACWGDSSAARALGLTTYLSEPVRIGENDLFGTLCGASTSKVAVTQEARRVLAMFAKLIARQLERDQLLEALKRENRTFSEYALTDPLTGIPNRRALLSELSRALANAERMESAVHLAFIDLDGFKHINDEYGHDAGDRFLISMAKALTAGLRGGDFVGRYGGDEFVVFCPALSADCDASRLAVRERLAHLTQGAFDIGRTVLTYDGASVGVVTSAVGEKDCEPFLKRADEAMYLDKKSRKRS